MDHIEKAIAEVQQARSNFQIDKFVIGQHSTPEMQYYQVCIELQDAIYKYQLAQINLKKEQILIDRLQATGDEIDSLTAQEKEMGMRQTRLALLGHEREMNHLISLWNDFGTKFSREEIELAQPQYWQARLTDNAKAMLMGGSPVNAAHIEAMEQAGILDSFVAEVEKTKKELA
jgi:hypothetical protein